MNKIYDLIFDELYKKNVNWTAITELVRSMGAEINNVVGEESTDG